MFSSMRMNRFPIRILRKLLLLGRSVEGSSDVVMVMCDSNEVQFLAAIGFWNRNGCGCILF